jgi:hypothetical protein
MWSSVALSQANGAAEFTGMLLSPSHPTANGAAEFTGMLLSPSHPTIPSSLFVWSFIFPYSLFLYFSSLS